MNEETALRIAVALEQLALDLADVTRRMSYEAVRAEVQPTPVREVPQTAQAPSFPPIGWTCPVHGGNRIVPAGISGKTGRPYAAFMVCAATSCEERPPRVASSSRALP